MKLSLSLSLSLDFSRTSLAVIYGSEYGSWMKMGRAQLEMNQTGPGSEFDQENWVWIFPDYPKDEAMRHISDLMGSWFWETKIKKRATKMHYYYIWIW